MMFVSFQGWGGDAFPGSTPQYENDHRSLPEPWVHDEPDRDETSADGEYNFVFGNGQLHLSPHHDFDELANHAGVSDDSAGPTAVGRVRVDHGTAQWQARGNVSYSALVKALRDYSREVGWQWGGVTDLEGKPINDRYAPTASFYFSKSDGHIFLAEKPQHLAGRGDVHRITLAGSTAYVSRRFLRDDGLIEWANDAGFRLADYPGGSDMLDQLYNQEDLEQYNLGDSSSRPTPTKKAPLNAWQCRDCDQYFPDFEALAQHRRTQDHMQHEWPEEDGKFPKLDMDATLPPHYHERFPVTMPLASYKEAARVEGFNDYAPLWGFDTDVLHKHYGAYWRGQPVAFASVRESDRALPELVFVKSNLRGAGEALVRSIQQHYGSLATGIVSERGRRLVTKCGFVEVRSGVMKWAQGKEPKDILEAPVPFIYDVDKDNIAFGQPGQRTSDIQGEFTPGGIVEGEYQPGGNVLLTTDTNMPYTTRHLLDLFKAMYPHMEVTGVEREMGGQNFKIAGTNVGNYVKQVAATDPAVWQAYQALKTAGGQVYAVGGAVRDALLQEEPKDIDLMVTGLPPEQVEHVLNGLPGRMDFTGKSFGVYRYKTKGHEVEIALPRTEKSTGNRRVDFAVNVDHSLPVESDLLRRDFTINSMAVDLGSGRLVDPFHGAEDLAENRLRTTHPASLDEDPTRVLRALVMNARYGVHPDEQTRGEMSSYAHRLKDESWDNMQGILDKLFKAKDPAQAIRLAQETGVLQHVFPEVSENFDFDQNNPHHSYPLGDHLLNVLENTQRESTDPDLRLAALLHDIGKPASAWTNPETGFNHYYLGPNGEGADHAMVGATMAEARMRALRYPVSRSKRVRHLIEHHMWPAFDSPKGARKFINRVGDEHADDLLTLRHADQFGKGQSASELAARTSVDRQRGLVEQVRSAQQPTSQSGLFINGNDIIALGIKPGPTVGRILRYLTDEVVSDPALNNREALLQMAQEYVNAQ